MKSVLCIIVLLAVSISCQRFTDVVFVVDEGLPKDTFIWINETIQSLEDNLKSQGVGDQPDFTNLYGLVLFGSKDANIISTNDGPKDNPRRYLFNENLELATSQVFQQNMANIVNNLNPTDQTHDGYQALNRALNFFWRVRSIRTIIFLTDKDRDIVYQNISKEQLTTKLLDSGVLLNQLLDIKIVTFQSDNLTPNPGYGIYYTNTTYGIYNTDGVPVEQTPFAKVYTNQNDSSMIYDYVSLSEAVSRPEHGSAYSGSVGFKLHFT